MVSAGFCAHVGTSAIEYGVSRITSVSRITWGSRSGEIPAPEGCTTEVVAWSRDSRRVAVARFTDGELTFAAYELPIDE